MLGQRWQIQREQGRDAETWERSAGCPCGDAFQSTRLPDRPWFGIQGLGTAIRRDVPGKDEGTWAVRAESHDFHV